MKTLSTLLCAATLMLAPVAAWAQPAAAPADADEAQREALATRYFADVHLDAQIRRVVDTVMPLMLGQLMKDKPNLSDAERAKISDIVRDAALKGLAEIEPDYDRGVIRVVASTYTVDELTAMVSFYETPTGQSIITKQAQLVGPMGQVMVNLMPRMQAVMARQICEKMGCGAPSAGAKGSGPA